jgi:CRP-like cAMP-binding protein
VIRTAQTAARPSDSHLFDGVPELDVATLAQATTRRLVRGEHLWHSGGPANGVYVVHSGEVADFLVDADGAEVLHLVHEPV